MFERRERPIGAVPRPVRLIAALMLAAQVGLQAALPRPSARAADLPEPPTAHALRGASLGEPIPAAQLTALFLQAHDNQPGISIPYRELDYDRVREWLATILAVDPVGQYPLLMATQLYGQVIDVPKQRTMCAFTEQAFIGDPDRRWRWLAHCAIMAKHRIQDLPLALRYARQIAEHAKRAPGWARQMELFFLEDMGEFAAARVLLGGLLASGAIADPAEAAFLTSRLEALSLAEKSSMPSKK